MIEHDLRVGKKFYLQCNFSNHETLKNLTEDLISLIDDSNFTLYNLTVRPCKIFQNLVIVRMKHKHMSF